MLIYGVNDAFTYFLRQPRSRISIVLVFGQHWFQMSFVRLIIFLAILVLSACAKTPDTPQFRAFDLELTHPSAYSTYILVTPGLGAADLPSLRQVNSLTFSKYLRESTGCVADTSHSATAIGSKRIPAGYMIPIVCP